MKILVLGAAGMLGHKLVQHLSERHSVTGTVRDDAKDYARHPILGDFSLLGGIRAEDIACISSAITERRPDVVLNAIGVVKQRPEGRSPIPSIEVNALFPHKLANVCAAVGARLIHFSTDCVFSGRTGNYGEADVSDAGDLYGRTKFLGEVNHADCLTIRSSIIGREIAGHRGLVEWLVANRHGRVPGYTRALYSGITTIAMATLVAEIIENHRGLQGLRQAASQPISKFDLLVLLNEELRLGITIVPDDSLVCDRSLNGETLRKELGFAPPSWHEMVRELALDRTPYDGRTCSD